MIEKRLKFRYWYVIIAIFVLLPLITIKMLVSSDLSEEIPTDYVSKEIINDSLPVINDTVRVINPYTDPSVTIGKNYYDYKGESEEQEKSILVHDNTYIQNTGIDYINDNKFEIVAILNGTVQTVKEDDTVGKTVEIKHEDGYISIYQSLSEIKVKKGDIVNQGQVIGISGENELDKDLGNHLHFEIYNNGSSINPENYLNKEISLKKEN